MNFKDGFSVGPQTQVVMIMVSVLMVACGGGGGGGSSTPIQNVSRSGPGTLIPIPTPPVPGNVVPIAIDAGPVSGVSQINVAYVSVTVCTPGTSGNVATCQTIDHVMLDTGSSGLRLLNSALYSNLNLPVVKNSSNQAIGECMTFADGITWGSVRTADIYLGGEVATSVPIQVIGDQPGGVPGIPNTCSYYGAPEDTQALLGANGILGVGLFANDCDACLSQIVDGTYYTCTSTKCSESVTPQTVPNPVAIFSQDNNGVLIDLPSVSAAGATNLPGYLYFGIGTQTNNQLVNNQQGSATVYATDSYGNFSTTYNGTSMTSYIDSGSNAVFFYDTSVHKCSVSTWAYCPPSPLSLSAINTAASGSNASPVNFSIVNIDGLAGNVTAANIGGTSARGQFAWGLPFFFGQKVFTAISGVTPPTGVPAGPFWAY